jgi:hypothetical protein
MRNGKAAAIRQVRNWVRQLAQTLRLRRYQYRNRLMIHSFTHILRAGQVGDFYIGEERESSPDGDLEAT